jgi:hypothetical protein
VHDDIRRRLGDGSADSLRIEDVEHDRRCAKSTKVTHLAGGSRRPDDLVAVRGEQGNESLPNRSCCACNEDPHDFAPFIRFVP